MATLPTEPKLSAFWRVVILFAVAMALLAFLSSVVAEPKFTGGLKVLGAVFGLIGTFVQIHLASYGGAQKRAGETMAALRDRLNKRDDGDVIGWACLGASVLFIAAAELSEAGIRLGS